MIKLPFDISKFPILPEVALIYPVIFALVDFNAPALVTVKGAVVRLPSLNYPAQILTFPLSVTLPFRSDLLSIFLLHVIPATILSLSIITTSSEDSSLL